MKEIETGNMIEIVGERDCVTVTEVLVMTKAITLKGLGQDPGQDQSPERGHSV
jgi:hypothetical protein